MISIEHLSVSTDGKSVLSDISLAAKKGERVLITGENGSGKSSLLLTLMRHYAYTITHGAIVVGSEEVTEKSAYEIAQMGVFWALQSVPEIPGIRMGEYLRTIHSERMKRDDGSAKGLSPFLFKRMIAPIMTEIGLSEGFLDRDLNGGFSWGEKRRSELLQMYLLRPSIILLDEIDSGIDSASLPKIAEFIRQFVAQDRTLLFVSHSPQFVELMAPTQVMTLSSGKKL